MSAQPQPKTNVIRLDQARRYTPPVDPIEACKRSLNLSVYDKLSETDVTDIVGTLKEKAKAGDLKAIQMVIALITAAPQKPQASTNIQVNNYDRDRDMED